MNEEFISQGPNDFEQKLAERNRWKIRFTWNHLKNEVQADVHHMAYTQEFRVLLNEYNADLEKLIKGNSHLLKRVKDITAWKIRFIWNVKERCLLEDSNKIAMSPALKKLNARFKSGLEKIIRANERMLT